MMFFNTTLKKRPTSTQSDHLVTKPLAFPQHICFQILLKKYDGKCLVSTVDGNIIYIFTTRDIGNELALLEVTFKGTKIDVQKNLTQDEKKDIHRQTSTTRKEEEKKNYLSLVY